MDSGMIFVLVILFGFAMPIAAVGMWSSHKKDMAKMKGKLDDSEKQDLQNQINGMKSRLEVLEAIVTDKGYQLRSEIDQLSAKDNLQ